MKTKKKENYLERVPMRHPRVESQVDENGIVTLKIENKGVFNRAFQKLLKKPKYSYIHLDENGSFVWECIDGKRDIIEIGNLVDEHFGEAAHPVYDRLSKFFVTLENCKFITY